MSQGRPAPMSGQLHLNQVSQGSPVGRVAAGVVSVRYATRPKIETNGAALATNVGLPRPLAGLDTALRKLHAYSTDARSPSFTRDPT